MRNLFAIVLALAVQTAECAAETWQPLKPDGLGFSAAMPGVPEMRTQETPVAPDKSIGVTSYMLKAPSGQYGVTVIVLPPGDPSASLDVETRYDEVQAGTLQTFPGKLRTSQKVTIDGKPGREIIVDADNRLAFRSRFLILGDRVYQSGFLNKKGQELGETSDQFFASFKVLDGPAPPAAPAGENR